LTEKIKTNDKKKEMEHSQLKIVFFLLYYT